MSDGRLLARAGTAPVSPAETLAALAIVARRSEEDRRRCVAQLLPTMSAGGELTLAPERVSRALVAWLGTGRLAVERAPVRLLPVASLNREVSLKRLLGAGLRVGVPVDTVRRLWDALPREPHASITVVQDVS